MKASVNAGIDVQFKILVSLLSKLWPLKSHHQVVFRCMSAHQSHGRFICKKFDYADVNLRFSVIFHNKYDQYQIYQQLLYRWLSIQCFYYFRHRK